jgi:prolyl-tRNA synthetase
MEKVSTPAVKTISDLMRFFGAGEEHFLKTVAYEADGELVLAIIRGDFAVSETKLTNHLKAVHLGLAPEALLSSKGLYGGFLSPVGLKGIRMVLDTSVDEQAVFVAGGNEPDTHVKNVLLGRDFHVQERVDIAEVRAGDPCAQCGDGALQISRGIELGHTFKLGTKYTAAESMDVTFLDASGDQQRVVMGCYGIGVERLMASAIERWHDDAGMVFPVQIAPFQVILSSLGRKPEVLDTAERLYGELRTRYETLYDDRDESPGVKLKDADLLGIPVRVVVSQRLLKTKEVEIKVRSTGEVVVCPEGDLRATLDRVMASLELSLDGLPFMPE